MQPNLNLWIEQDGKVALSNWRVDLLEAIEATGSISAAAVQMNVSYRRAWTKLKEMEEALGIKVVEGTVGGRGGGGATLTPEAEKLVRLYNDFRQGIDSLVQKRFEKTFGSQWNPP